MSLLYISKVPGNRTSFANKVKEISAKLGIEPDWLMAVMHNETGGTFRASIKNPNSGATGLIQFMPKTAKGLGTSTTALSRLSEVQQLDWVYIYLEPYAGKMIEPVDVYLAVFWPAAIGKSEDYIFQSKKLTAYQVATENKIFDLNKDKKITKKEFRKYWNQKFPALATGEKGAGEKLGEKFKRTTSSLLYRNKDLLFVAFILIIIGLTLIAYDRHKKGKFLSK